LNAITQVIIPDETIEADAAFEVELENLYSGLIVQVWVKVDEAVTETWRLATGLDAYTKGGDRNVLVFGFGREIPANTLKIVIIGSVQ
jgi:hypothetical protein